MESRAKGQPIRTPYVSVKWITADLLRKAQEAKAITSDDAELVRKADLEGKGVVAAGEELGMPKSTASTKHKKILQSLRRFNERDEANKQKGEAAPRVFGLLDKKKGLTEIVEVTGYDPEIVEKLQEDYIRLKEKDLNLPSVPKRLAELERDVWDLMDSGKYWEMIFQTVTNQPGFHPYCPNCFTEMTAKDHFYVCDTCKFKWP
jgi:hypothetical protein